MATKTTKKRRKKVKKTAAAAAPMKKRRKKVKKTAAPTKKRSKKASPSKKDGFPTAREMKDARDDFAADVGVKILTQSQAKALPKAMGLRASADFLEALANKVYVDVLKAGKRCVANDRKTLRPDDL